MYSSWVNYTLFAASACASANLNCAVTASCCSGNGISTGCGGHAHITSALWGNSVGKNHTSAEGTVLDPTRWPIGLNLPYERTGFYLLITF